MMKKVLREEKKNEKRGDDTTMKNNRTILQNPRSINQVSYTDWHVSMIQFILFSTIYTTIQDLKNDLIFIKF
jgi:hypothetical protein